MKWNSAFSSQQLHLATMVVTILEDRGINAVLINKRDSNYPIGWYEVHVQFTQLLEAKHFIGRITDLTKPQVM